MKKDGFNQLASSAALLAALSIGLATLAQILVGVAGLGIGNIVSVLLLLETALLGWLITVALSMQVAVSIGGFAAWFASLGLFSWFGILINMGTVLASSGTAASNVPS